jgi:two-component system response regulator DevR
MLVDDYEIIRFGLRAMFERQPDVEVVAEAGSVAEAVRQALVTLPDLILMDVRLPDGSGVDATREIRAAAPDIRIVFLTAFEDEEAFMATMQGGADGFLRKELEGSALLAAVRAAMRGVTVIDPHALELMCGRARPDSGQDTARTPAAADAALSTQEKRVLAELAAGKTNKEIGKALELSEKTVRNYLNSIFKKLNVARRAEAVAYYMRHRPR